MFGRRNADARVGHDELDRVFGAVDRHRDDSALGRELHGVRDEIVEHLREPDAVAVSRRRVVRDHLDGHALLGGRRAGRLDGARRKLGDVDRPEAQLDTLRLDLGDQQQVFNECVQPFGAPADHLEVLAAGLVEALLLVLHHLEEA